MYVYNGNAKWFRTDIGMNTPFPFVNERTGPRIREKGVILLTPTALCVMYIYNTPLHIFIPNRTQTHTLVLALTPDEIFLSYAKVIFATCYAYVQHLLAKTTIHAEGRTSRL